MIRLNKKQIITISIVIAVIFASVLAITIAAQDNKLEMSSDLTVSQVSDVTAGQNGVVADGYTTSYTSGTAIIFLPSSFSLKYSLNFSKTFVLLISFLCIST